MEKNDFYSMLSVLDHTVLAALPRGHSGTVAQLSHHPHHHHYNHQLALASSLFAGNDFEPTPIHEISRPDENQLLRQVLTQANNVIDAPDADFLLYGSPSLMSNHHHGVPLLGNPPRSSPVPPVAAASVAAVAAKPEASASTEEEEANLVPDVNRSSSKEEAATASDTASSSSSSSPPIATLSPAVTSGRWYDRFQDLVTFKQEFGHCCVPSHWPKNPPLAQWVKRQRHQYKRSKDNLHSTITPARIEALDKMGFVWDPHAAFWEERLDELHRFRDKYGHCNVPTKFPDNPQLAIWAKCQRRQFKLFVSDGPKKSNMTVDRIAKLSRVGFVFNPRQINKRR